MRLTIHSGLLTAAVVAAAAAGAAGFGTAGGPPRDVPEFTGNTYAVIVSGIAKDPTESQEQEGVLTRFRDMLVEDFKLDDAKVTYLTSAAGSDASTAATAAALKKAVEKVRGAVGVNDRFIFYYKGQANVVNGTLRINLEGPDIAHDDLAAMLAPVKCATMLVILDCPNAGLAVESLTGAGRIIICGARGDQPYATRFSGFFVAALTDPEADFDQDGAVSLLEAYRMAVTRIDEAYQKDGLLKTENALLEDDGDGVPTHQPWERIEDSFDGAAAAKFFFAKLPAIGS